jgi:hypothetical protein
VGCEEVIQVDLKTSEQRIVIEAIIDAEDGISSVLISKTGSFYQTDEFEKISGASVILTLPNGNQLQLADSGNGSYGMHNILLSPGDVVNIKIITPDNITYLASSSVPIPVPLDSLSIEQIDRPFGGKANYLLSAIWFDPEDSENFYRLRITKNDTLQANLYSLADDRVRNGIRITQPISGGGFKKSDEVIVEMLSVDKNYYDYFSQLNNIEGRGFMAPTPFNPKGNFSNDALGYFGIYYKSAKRITIK